MRVHDMYECWFYGVKVDLYFFDILFGGEINHHICVGMCIICAGLLLIENLNDFQALRK